MPVPLYDCTVEAYNLYSIMFSTILIYKGCAYPLVCNEEDNDPTAPRQHTQAKRKDRRMSR